MALAAYLGLPVVGEHEGGVAVRVLRVHLGAGSHQNLHHLTQKHQTDTQGSSKGFLVLQSTEAR